MAPENQWRGALSEQSIFKDIPSRKGSGQSLLVIRGTEIFIAVGRKVRYIDVASSNDFLELDLPNVDFEIQSIKLNDLRSILVVAGLRKLIVAFLPRGRHALERTIKTSVIGEQHHADTTISQVRVHPYCATSTSLVVLTTNSMLRLYNIQFSCDEAELSVDLCTDHASRQSNSFGMAQDSPPVDFCFGNGGDGWTTFSIMTLMQDGDVVIVSPVLPSACLVSDTNIERFGGCIRDDPQAAVFADRILHAVARGSRSSTGINFSRPARLLNPVVSSPILFDPPPVEVAKLETEARSIIFLPTQPVNTLAIATDEQVDISLLLEPLPGFARAVTSIAVHETIRLEHKKDVALLTCALEDDMSFFVLHRSGAERIVMKEWLISLDTAFNADSVTSKLQMGHSEFTTVSSSDSLLYSAAFYEQNLENYLISLHDGSSIQISQIDGGPAQGPNNSEVEDDAGQSAEEKDELIEQVRYQSLLAAPAYRPSKSEPQRKFDVPPHLSHKPINPSVESLQIVSSMVLQSRAELEALMSSFVSMYRRLAMQQKEFGRQEAKFVTIKQSLDALEDKSGDRLDRARERQADLERRYAKLSQTLMKTHSPKLSDAEKKYFSELTRIHNLLHGPRGMLTRKAAAEAQLETIRKSLAGVSTTKQAEHDSTESPLRTTQLSQIKAQIESNEEVLSQVKSRIERLNRLSMAT